MTNQEVYIKRCLKIAKNGLGSTRPNPMVGAVIVYNDTIIGEGFTSAYGNHHAEVNAINSVKDKTILSKSTLYVTLEPCSHFGKTPPCSDLITQYKIPEVVIGCIDDNPEVAGKGIAKLKASDCKVTVGVLEDECKVHHKRFFTFHNKKRPYIILKWAETSDGFIAPKSRDKQKPVWITNAYSRQLVHKWRTEEQAILVGTNTVLEDNPSLTVRDWNGQNPIRVVLDRTSKLSSSFNVFNDEAETIRVTNNVIDYEQPIAIQICDLLYNRNINSIIIEGGAKTLQTFIDEGFWDEARVFIGSRKFNEGTKAPKLKGQLISEAKIINDSLKVYQND
ncbi:bifunctional diaminohydroxyphosphoribosylaminopyrimidine deaminase/5-amino-6-(5-phosphoribosylamino)uracil reductase RibD [Winogradskyella sp.]|uniref:bifunctional diaminohydroxyphosphoribosylaminopyrimidine deaminase/5-amino-6-(5-phosphoribosylamino)uracil reductase RibD n=1 Tax=Winogradskyella sp. TaxID=1883156 RepID=UPI0025D07EF8|nr:bifunctional diaminohydroxyphosphoribosylaminopyrimidine deaminase/5-amino-6-(5-phosphoribosylamino)uracil reductase RibD [Winogradskyella sp.]